MSHPSITPLRRRPAPSRRGALASALRALARIAVLASLAAVSLTTAALATTPPLGSPPPTDRPPALVPLDQAFLTAATALFDAVPVGAERTVVVIDPLLDGVTGIQTAATRGFDERIARLVEERYPHIEILPLSVESLERARFVFIGTFNTINNAGQPTGPRDAHWICFVLVEKETSTVFARTVSRASLADVDVAPARFYADTPVWGLDEATTAYIELCQRSRPGDPVAPGYLAQLGAAARIREATVAYESGDAQRSLALYREARALPGGEQVRTLNGLYLTLTALGERDEADEAFSELVGNGLRLGRLGVLFLFEPGSTGFNDAVPVAASYTQWLEEISAQAALSTECLAVVGHASRTGPEAFNVTLSKSRAERIIALLTERAPGLGERLTASGVGSAEVLVGLPRDDASTDIDRRVEFKPADCA